jgi:chorismate synthase
MNSFGRFLRFQICGESHGHGVGAILDGIPSGLPIDLTYIQEKLDRRRPGQNQHTTQRKEADKVKLLSGVFNESATGAPLFLWIDNHDTKSKHYDNIRKVPRPGHADWTGHVRHRGYQDPRGGGHFSGRLTAPLVAAGAIAQGLLAAHGIRVSAHLHQVGNIAGAKNSYDVATLDARVCKSTIQTAHSDLEDSFKSLIDTVRSDKGDTIGGVIEFRAEGMPVGAGEPWSLSVESHLSQILFAVPAVKGVSFGAGFAAAEMKGSEHNDAYRMDGDDVSVLSNHAGGILGGLTTGAPIWGHVAIKPTSSIFQPQDSIDLTTGENATLQLKGRHDPIIAVRAVPVIEAAVALGLADLLIGLHAEQRTGSPWADKTDF